MKLGVTYLMKSQSTKAESYIELPAMECLKPLAFGEECGIGKLMLEETLKNIAILQGYGFIAIEKIDIIE